MGRILKQLRETRELLGDPKRWTQGQNAKTAEGAFTLANHPEAVCFCLFGAILKIIGNGNGGIRADQFLEESYTSYPLRGADKDDNYIAFNDCSTHAEVMAFLDFAIERAERLGV